MAWRKAVRGITWAEFAVVLLVISVFAAVLLFALHRVEQKAERSVFEMTASHMKSGLRLQVAELMMSNRLQEMDRLVGSNPVLLLQRPPSGYLGETDGKGKYAKGTWHFDRSRRELVYRFQDWGPAAGPIEGRLWIQARRHSSAESSRPAEVEGIEMIVRVIL